MNKGVSDGALAQFHKHSDDHSMQRISEQVIQACRDVGKLLKSDVPELPILGLPKTTTKYLLDCSFVCGSFKAWCNILHRWHQQLFGLISPNTFAMEGPFLVGSFRR